MRKNKKTEGVSIKGFFRVQVKDKESGKIVGDTGYMANQITNYGLASCLVGGPAGAGSTVQIAGAVLGSGTNPATDATALDNSHDVASWYSTVGQAINGSTQAQFTQTFDGSYAAITIANVALLAASDGSLIAGKTFASSAVATTQDVNLTYNLNYST